ncbi:MAG: hypothetical protein ACYDHO_01805 [Gaiellaceae bacterium]
MSSLDRSTGFRVASSGGYVGTVKDVVYGADANLSALVVATELATMPLALVGAEEVLHCSEDAAVVILSPRWRDGALKMPVAVRLVA